MEQRDIEFAATPRKWPMWPWLPLKRKVTECALLHADTGPETKPVILYDADLFEVKTHFPTPAMRVAATYPRWREFADSDWRVD